tara:strand:+ start:1365 stop:1487 length:123 start_codon:yes stop_codon:yes gene_type:complete
MKKQCSVCKKDATGCMYIYKDNNVCRKCAIRAIKERKNGS